MAKWFEYKAQIQLNICDINLSRNDASVFLNQLHKVWYKWNQQHVTRRVKQRDNRWQSPKREWFYGVGTATALRHDLQQATPVHVSEQTVKRQTGGINAWHLLVWPALAAPASCCSISIQKRPELAAFAVCTLFCSHWAHVTGVKESGKAVVNMMLNAMSSNTTDLAVSWRRSREVYLHRLAQTLMCSPTTHWQLLRLP